MCFNKNYFLSIRSIVHICLSREAIISKQGKMWAFFLTDFQQTQPVSKKISISNNNLICYFKV